MATTSSRQFRFDRLRAKGPDAAIVIKLMMACNDMSLANQALDDWKRPQARDRIDTQLAACMYFVRVELAHLYEALKIIQEVQVSPGLSALVQQCDIRTRESFSELLNHVHGGCKHKRLQQLVGQLRHNLTFHYHQCDKLILSAIDDRASRPEANHAWITRASTAHRWRFSLADDVIDSVVVRQLWAIPRDADLRVESDKIADEVHAVMLRYLDFAGEFAWKYVEQ
jgi:hypothetical protein